MKEMKYFVVVIFISLLISCPDYNNPYDPEADKYLENGGIVFYLDGAGGGLAAAVIDQGINNYWGGYGTDINGDYANRVPELTNIGAGAVNSEIIVAVYGANEPYNGSSNYAAKLCDDLVLNGYDDWFLPSKEELNLMYEQKAIIGGFADDDYWSSSETSAYSAWTQDFGDGSQFIGTGKHGANRVRAIRAFTY